MDARRARRSTALLGVTRELAEAVTNSCRLTDLLVRHAEELVGDAVTVWLLQPATSRLEVVGSTHAGPDRSQLLEEIQLTLVRREPGQDLAQAALISGRALFIADFEDPGAPDGHPTYGTSWMKDLGASSLAVVPLRARGKVTGVVAVSRSRDGAPYTLEEVEFIQALADCAAVALDNAAIQEQLRRQGDLVNLVSDAIISVDSESRVLSWNSAAEMIYGWPAAEALGRDLYELLQTRFIADNGDALDRSIVVGRLKASGSWAGELCERDATGRELEILTSITALPGAEGLLGGAVVVNRDVTAQRAAAREASWDPLTNLLNRRTLQDRLIEALRQAERDNDQTTVFFVDLDDFKRINDTWGHDCGDAVLIHCADALRRSVRDTDLVARYGGDEFVIIANRVDTATANTIASRLVANLAIPPQCCPGRLTVTASIGITRSNPGDDAHDVLARADSAMYEAKRSRNRRQAFRSVVRYAGAVADQPGLGCIGLGAGDDQRPVATGAVEPAATNVAETPR